MSEIYSAILYEEDYSDPEVEHKIEVFAKFYPPSSSYYKTDIFDEIPEAPDWEIIETYLNDDKKELEEIADKVYFFDYKTDTERKMTAQELQSKLIQALNDQGEHDDLPF